MPFDVPLGVRTVHIVYTVMLTGARVDLEGGKILLTIDGHAHTTTSWLPDFGFRVRQPFRLVPSGPTADLIVDDVAIDITTGGLTGWLLARVLGLFKDAFRPRINHQRDAALEHSHARETVRRRLSAEESLGGVLRSLLTPAGRRPPLLGPGYQLAYTAIDIRPAAIVLHGALTVAAWPAPHVEFEQVPTSSTAVSQGGVAQGPDYSALKSWIPGGTIQRYEWSEEGHAQPSHTDEHAFVLVHAGPQVSDGTPSTAPVTGYVPLCLTVRGLRVSSSGPLVQEAISATVCGWSSIPIVNGLAAAAHRVGPLIALARPDARGMVEVVGHAAPGDDAGGRPPNVLVHFTGERVG